MHRRLRALRSLEALLLGPDAAARAVASAIDDWPWLFQRARHHAVAGWLRRRLEVLGVAPPSDVARALSRRDVEDELWFLHLVGTLSDVTRAFTRDGVSYVALKGPALAVRVVDPAHARRSTDLDLLVGREHLATATAILGAMGYRRLESDALRDHAATHFVHATLPGLELHHAAHVGFGDELGAEVMLERARSVDVMGTAVQIPDPALEIAYLAAHAAGHRFERLAWLLDIAKLLDARAASLADVGVAAARLNAQRALVLTLAEIDRARGVAEPHRGARARLVLLAEERAVGSNGKALLNALSSVLLADDPKLAASFVKTKLARDLGPRLRSWW